MDGHMGCAFGEIELIFGPLGRDSVHTAYRHEISRFGSGRGSEHLECLKILGLTGIRLEARCPKRDSLRSSVKFGRDCPVVTLHICVAAHRVHRPQALMTGMSLEAVSVIGVIQFRMIVVNGEE